MKTTIFVGDVHGRLDALKRFLRAADCVEHGNGTWKLPKNTELMFVGDLIDTGPAGRQVVALVRQLIEQGDARCIMGNHEFNFAQYHTPNPQKSGDFLRPHTEKNRGQIRATLESYKGYEDVLQDDVEWMRSLPIAVKTNDYRCVHSCWHEVSLMLMKRGRDGQFYIPEAHWADAADEASPYFDAVEMLCKGPEITMPNEASYIDNYGNQRFKARVSWWHDKANCWGDVLRLPVADVEGLDLNAPVTIDDIPSNPSSAAPVFFGHYWFDGAIGDRQPVADNAACVDYSCARTEQLVGYKFIPNGEPLCAEHFVEDTSPLDRDTVVVFSHGKESGPWGSKIKRLAELATSLEFKVESIDYTSTQNPDERVAILRTYLSKLDKPFVLVGSSMGGYASMVAAQTHAPRGLFLLAPALYMPGYEIQTYSPKCENVEIVHGTSDDVIPYQNSVDYSLGTHCGLHLIVGDHRLNSSLDEVAALFQSFLKSL